MREREREREREKREREEREREDLCTRGTHICTRTHARTHAHAPCAHHICTHTHNIGNTYEYIVVLRSSATLYYDELCTMYVYIVPRTRYKVLAY